MPLQDTDPTPSFGGFGLRRPVAGIQTFDLILTSEDIVGDIVVVSGDVRNADIGTLLCFEADGSATACFDGATLNVDTVSFVEFTVLATNTGDALPTAEYGLTVAARDKLDPDGQAGVPTALRDPFIVDTAPEVSDLTKVGPDVDATPTFAWTSTDAEAIGKFVAGVAFHRVHIESERLIDIVVPGIPQLVSPADGAPTNDTTPSFTWDAVAGDVSTGSGLTYILQIDTSTGDFADPVTLLVTATGDVIEATVDAGDALASGDYVWRVRAVDRSGNIGDFSAPLSFTVDTTTPGLPTLQSPTDGSSGDDPTPTFTWTGVVDPSGVSYDLEIAFGTADFNTLALTADGIQATQFTLSTDLDTGDYIWHVRAVDGVGNTGDFGAAFTFTVNKDVTTDQPTLLSPPDGSSGDDPTPTFTWTEVADPAGVTYTLEIALGTADFANLAFTADGIQQTQFILPDANALATGDYIWRVRAVDGAGNSAESASFTFTVITDVTTGVPTLISPADGFTGDDPTPTFTWTEVVDPAGGVTYTLEIRTLAPATVFLSPPIQTTEFTLPSDKALATGVYTWHVVAADGAGNTMDSAQFTFTVVTDTTPPGVPTLISPADGFTGSDTTPTFAWGQVQDPTGVTFNLEIDFATGDFTAPVFTADGVEEPQLTLPNANALATGDYAWRVRAVDGASNTGGFSGTFTFTVDTTAPAVPDTISPVAGETVGPTPTFTWVQVTEDQTAITYTLEIATGDAPPTGVSFVVRKVGIADDAVASGAQQVIKFTLGTGDALQSGDHTWHVQAVDAAGNPSGFSTAVTLL